jgi:hypothetical protein
MSSSVITALGRLPLRFAQGLCHICWHDVHLRTHDLFSVESPQGHLDRAGPLGFAPVSVSVEEDSAADSLPLLGREDSGDGSCLGECLELVFSSVGGAFPVVLVLRGDWRFVSCVEDLFIVVKGGVLIVVKDRSAGVVCATGGTATSDRLQRA